MKMEYLIATNIIFLVIVAVILGFALADEFGRTKMFRCPSGHEAFSSGRFCTECGQKMQRVTAPRCNYGHRLGWRESYCRKCGSKKAGDF